MPNVLRLFLILALSAGAAAAQAAEWTVARVTGQAWIQTPDGGQVGMAAGMTIPKGATAQTGAKGRAILTDGASSMVLAPRTLVAVPYKPERGLETTVLQQLGSVEFEVEKRGRPHFSVQTPILAAVVKGTHFTVSVTGQTADVAVERGLVGVTDLKTGENADVAAGQAAGVRADGSFQVSGAAQPKIKAGKPKASLLGPAVASTASDATATTDGTGTSAGVTGSTGAPGTTPGTTAGVDGTGVADVGVAAGPSGVGVGASVGGGTVGVGVSVGSGGVGVGASVGGTVGVGVSAGSGGVGVGTSVGGVGVSVGGGSSGSGSGGSGSGGSGSGGTSSGNGSLGGTVGGAVGGSLGGTVGGTVGSLGL